MAIPDLLGLPFKLKEQILEYVIVPKAVVGMDEKITYPISDKGVFLREFRKSCSNGDCLLVTLLACKQMKEDVIAIFARHIRPLMVIYIDRGTRH